MSENITTDYHDKQVGDYNDNKHAKDIKKKKNSDTFSVF